MNEWDSEHLFMICCLILGIFITICVTGCNMYNSKKFTEGHYCNSLIRSDSSIWIKCGEDLINGDKK